MIQIENKYTGKVILEVETLCGADLRNTDLSDADLSGSNLRGAKLSNADLKGANLRNTDLRNTDLSDADLRFADLRGVNLSSADLSNTYLYSVNLRNADIWGAINYYSFVAYDTSKRLVHCVKHDTTWMVQAGCFWGTLEELERKVLHTHKSPVYLANIEILKTI